MELRLNPVECSLADAICLSPLGGLPLVLRDRLLAGAIRVDVPASGMIYREDDVPRCALVVSGLVRVYMTSPTGREVTVRYGRRGDLLGIAALVGGPAPVNVQMLTDVTVLFLNTSTLAATARTDPAVAWLFTEDITQRLYETLGVLAHQTFGSLRQRIAGHLLDLAAGHSNGCQLFAPVTQQAIADAVGSVRPAVARIVAQLRSQGLIETSPGGVIVLDAAQLYEEVFPRVR
ncbi:MAG TPA: Crp/Fnr family transcriptional regulator [Thermomicrobiales bacterium]|nr:Crp/Fnr family transcriptional regulator [Thermomicrobiales bacterium]